MEVMITISVLFVAQTSANVCNNLNGFCCADYKMVEGVCHPCYGSFGVDCTENCSAGFFGFGCRSKCDCKANQLCDSKRGCMNINAPCKLTNCSYVEKAFTILTSAHGINVCYNSTAENVECCTGFTNITGICERNVENFTKLVDFTTDDAALQEEELFGGNVIIIICVLSALLGSTWLIVAVFFIYKKRHGNLQQSNTRDTQGIMLETRSFTQNYDDPLFTDVRNVYTEAGNPYQRTPETTYMHMEPKM